MQRITCYHASKDALLVSYDIMQPIVTGKDIVSRRHGLFYYSDMKVPMSEQIILQVCASSSCII